MNIHRSVTCSRQKNSEYVAELNLGWATWRIEVAGQYANLTDEYTGLSIVDISDPVHPVRVGQQAVAGRANHAAVAGDYAYVIHGSSSRYGLSVFNVADPAHPALVVTSHLPGYRANCLTVVGDHVLVANGREGLVILQAQPPQRPELSIRPVGPDALITWPVSALGSTLDSKTDLNTSGWLPVLDPPQVDAEVFSISRPALSDEFFRLRRQ